jgi:hypothetical protein
MLRTHRFTIAAAVIAVCATSPAAAHALISPDALDAGDKATPQVAQKQDRRSPDAASPFEPTFDMRSPDVRYGQPTGQPAPTPTPTRVRIVELPSNGFEWGDAVVGAAGMLALVLVGVGVAMAGVHRRGRRFPVTTR